MNEQAERNVTLLALPNCLDAFTEFEEPRSVNDRAGGKTAMNEKVI